MEKKREEGEGKEKHDGASDFRKASECQCFNLVTWGCVGASKFGAVVPIWKLLCMLKSSKRELEASCIHFSTSTSAILKGATKNKY